MSPLTLFLRKATPALFFLAAVLFAVEGVIGVVSGDNRRAASGLSMGLVWLILGLGVWRRQRASRS